MKPNLICGGNHFAANCPSSKGMDKGKDCKGGFRSLDEYDPHAEGDWKQVGHARKLATVKDSSDNKQALKDMEMKMQKQRMTYEHDN